MFLESEVTNFQQRVIIGIIRQLETRIITNGLNKQDLATLWTRKGYFHCRLGDNPAAKAAYERALKINPKNTTAEKALKSLQGVILPL